MDVINSLVSGNKELLSMLLTLLVGFLAWICKEIIESPAKQSRDTFFKIAEQRIRALSLLYNYVNTIMLFPQESAIKEDLQKIILSDKLAYIDEEIIINIMQIAFHEESDEKLVLQTSKALKDAICQYTRKIQKENRHFISLDTPNPYKRIIIYAIQLITIISFITLIMTAIYHIIRYLVTLSSVAAITGGALILIAMVILEKRIA